MIGTPIQFQTAKRAKVAGYDGKANYSYQLSLTERVHEEDGTSGPFGWEKGELSLVQGFFINNWEETDYTNNNWYHCAVPMQADLQKWLREEKDIAVLCSIEDDVRGKWVVTVYGQYEVYGAFELYSKGGFATYEDALEEGLQEALKRMI